MKISRTLGITLLALCVMVVVLFATIFALLPSDEATSGEEASNNFGLAFAAVLGVAIWIITALPMTVVMLVVDIVLFAVKNKGAAAIAVLVVLCIAAPVLGYNFVLYGALCDAKPAMMALPIIATLLYLVSFVLSCVCVHMKRKGKLDATQQQVTE